MQVYSYCLRIGIVVPQHSSEVFKRLDRFQFDYICQKGFIQGPSCAHHILVLSPSISRLLAISRLFIPRCIREVRLHPAQLAFGESAFAWYIHQVSRVPVVKVPT